MNLEIFTKLFPKEILWCILLSQKSTAKNSIVLFDKLYEPLNNFLAVFYEVMGKISSLEYLVTNKTSLHIHTFYK